MKKETVNLFNKGLNYDLNPLTTPNDVLTDCVNGTFITFNGDELILQNDAGNTKILKSKDSPGDPDEYVALSPGFHPIGVKEKGGILYIVSAKSPLLDAKEWENGVTYQLGNIIVKDGIYFYVRVANYTTNSTSLSNIELEDIDGLLLLEDDGIIFLEESLDGLEVLGSINIAKSQLEKYLGREVTEEIEFGSYPSPQVYTENSNVTNGIIKNLTSANSIVLNDRLFTAGTYLNLIGQSYNDSHRYLSTYRIVNNKLTKITRFFNLKLLQQLDNGVIDLTEDIWYKFLILYASVINNPNNVDLSWINVVPFNYYCPNNFKGKIAISVDIEPLEVFNINSAKIVESAGNRTFNISTTVKGYTNSWVINKVILYTKNNTNPVLFDNSGVAIPSTYKNFIIIPLTSTNTYSTSVSVTDGVWVDPTNESMYYEVHAVLQYNDGTTNQIVLNSDIKDYPSFRGSLIKSGSILLGTGVKDIKVNLFSNVTTCYNVEGTYFRVEDHVYITDLNDLYIDSLGNPTTVERTLKFIESGAAPGVVLGTYDINSNITWNNQYSYANGFKTAVETFLKRLLIRTNAPECGGVTLGVESKGVYIYGEIKLGDFDWEPMTNWNSKILPYDVTSSILTRNLLWAYPINTSIYLKNDSNILLGHVVKFEIHTEFIPSNTDPLLDRWEDYLVCRRPISTNFGIVSKIEWIEGEDTFNLNSYTGEDSTRILLRNYGVDDPTATEALYKLTILTGEVVETGDYFNLTTNLTNYRKLISGPETLLCKKEYLSTDFIFIYNS